MLLKYMYGHLLGFNYKKHLEYEATVIIFMNNHMQHHIASYCLAICVPMPITMIVKMSSFDSPIRNLKELHAQNCKILRHLHTTKSASCGIPRRGAHVKILTEMLVLFFGFEIWPNPIFLGWQIFSYFSGFRKISAIFLGLTNFQLFFGSSNFCITHWNPLNEEHKVLKNIK